MRLSFLTLMLLTVAMNAQTPPDAEISNGQLRAKIYLPDQKTGFYRGTRFDWSGVIGSLEFDGHNFYGPWFTKTDPSVHDFVYRGEDIVAGPCSAATGPVEEFSTHDKALGFDEAPPGGTFIKIGVGVLRRPDQSSYDNYRLYQIVDGGKWSVHQAPNSVEFVQDLMDPNSGYGYVYRKTITLLPGSARMLIAHHFKNTGRKGIESDVYDHNFLVLDGRPTGPDFEITLPFDFKTERPFDPSMAERRGNTFGYKKVLQDRDTVATSFSGFGSTPRDYHIAIQNRTANVGMNVSCDRPLDKLSLWSIRSTISMEPYVKFSVAPGEEFDWTYTYNYETIK